MAKNFKIQTPHAAVIVWNFNDRIGVDGTDSVDEVDTTIISTVSLRSIQTAKAKGSPVGTFQIELAPSKNWVAAITPGSWCAILMGNTPITKLDLTSANPDQVKMIGKIETVRADTVEDEDTRRTRYTISGVDWGHIFNSIMYVDNLIAAANDPRTLGSGAAIALRKLLFGNGNAPQSNKVQDNLRGIINIFGSSLVGFTEAGTDINRLANSIYDFVIPKEMMRFMKFVGPQGAPLMSQKLNKTLTLQTGSLIAPGEYANNVDSYGYVDPFSLQGTNTFWQILLDNSNPALNELYNEIVWTDLGPQLTLYNRTKPFSYKVKPFSFETIPLRSLFTFVDYHEIDPVQVVSINAGTNWRDKYNFIEIKPQFQEFNIIANWSKQKVQEFDQDAFSREGFRPLIVATKQFPGSVLDVGAPNFAALGGWTKLLREWYFDTHKLLNGTLTMTGSDEYIAVGNNIKFDATLLNPNANFNSVTSKSLVNMSILAHVENVTHAFTITGDGARTYQTVIQFVRGIVVPKASNIPIGEGTLDEFADDMSPTQRSNIKNTVVSSEKDDPDSKKSGGFGGFKGR